MWEIVGNLYENIADYEFYLQNNNFCGKERINLPVINDAAALLLRCPLL